MADDTRRRVVYLLRAKEMTVGQIHHELQLTPEMEERIQALEGVDFIGKQQIADYVNLIVMSDKQFEEWLNFERSRRNLLKSAVSQPIQVTVKQSRAK